ncbi:MAG: hypothetical protein ABR600_13660 [Actinomycetota bacterium]
MMSDRSSIRRLAAVLPLSVVVLASAGSTAFAGDAIHLPTRADATAIAPRTECLLNGINSGLPSFIVHGCLETRLPGAVSDRERVEVDVGPDGTPLGVRVTQHLELSGLGDFSFKVPGPATDVRGLPGSEEQPGLRKGAVLWQGFSPGRRVLGAVLDLHPDLEADLLPLRFTIDATIGGAPMSSGEPRSGPFEMTLRIANRTATPITIAPASTDPAAVGAALDTVRRDLEHGRRPVPGEHGLPESLPSTGAPTTRSARIEAPFRIEGELSFPDGTLTGAQVHGASLGGGSTPTIVLRQQLGGGAPASIEVRVTGVAHHLGLPRLVVHAEPAPPLASSVSPPEGGSASAYAAAHPSGSRRMVSDLLEALWRTARLVQFDAYLGNPDPAGPARSTYVFTLAAPKQEAAPVRTAGPGALDPIGALVFSLVALVVLLGLALAWSRA